MGYADDIAAIQPLAAPPPSRRSIEHVPLQALRKVYLAAPFRRRSTRLAADRAYGELRDQGFIDDLERIEDVFLRHGLATCLPHRDEGKWGATYYPPSSVAELCLRHVATSDLVFALAGASRGVHVEIGYAMGLGDKTIIVMHQKREELSTLLYGMVAARRGVVAEYEDVDDLIAQLPGLLIHLGYRPAKTPGDLTHERRSALIDVGSHTVKYRALSVRPGRANQLLREAKASLGIMDEVLKTGELSRSSTDALIALLVKWMAESRELGVDHLRIAATAAFRRAGNASEVRRLITDATGHDVDILSTEDEAQAVYRAVRTEFETAGKLAVLNLGGGSVQVAIGAGGTPDHVLSFDLGTRHIINRWPWLRGFTAVEYSALRQHVAAALTDGLHRTGLSAQSLVHTGGELEFLLRCQLPMTVYGHSRTHVSQVNVEDFDRFATRFAFTDPAEVAAQTGLDQRWLSGSVASNAIALSVAEGLGAANIIPSDLNVADGLIVEALA